MNKESIKCIISNNLELKDKIFARGFLFTDAEVDAQGYPFYGIWQDTKVETFHLFVSPKQKFCVSNYGNTTLVLIGHAYDPFTMEADEQVILNGLAETFVNSKNDFKDKFNQLTGVFTLLIVKDSEVILIGDPSGMQNAFYTNFYGKVFISSHTNLIGDLLSLEWDNYVKELAGYKFFSLLGNSLPGDLTQFKEVKRLIPNHFVIISDSCIKVKRFYTPTKLDLSREEIVDKVAEIMHNNMTLISQKWEKPAISLTGGVDSKTTLACTTGLYDMFRYFSYISNDSEKVDAEAAKKICDALGQEHTTYVIPDNDSELEKVPEVADILFWNTGGICKINPNDARKRIYFADTTDFDVEVKSWASEIGRSYYSKRFNERKDFGDRPSPRKCTTMYKFFLHNRKLVNKTDKVFAEYLRKYFRRSQTDPVDWQEQFFWEFRVPSWNGLVITGEHRYSFDITIPYNNRRILELLLSASIDDRINDTIYKLIRDKMNPVIDATGVAVTNVKHTKNREKAENLYYMFNCALPY